MIQRRDFLQHSGALALALSTSLVRARSVKLPETSAEAWQRAADIVKNLRTPTFPDRNFDITNYGAKPDGVTLNTKSIAEAIEACAKAGGGRVIVPAGKFRSISRATSICIWTRRLRCCSTPTRRAIRWCSRAGKAWSS